MDAANLDPNCNEFDTGLRALLPFAYPDEVHPTFWALCYLGDPDKVRNLPYQLADLMVNSAHQQIAKWVQKGYDSEDTPSQLPYISCSDKNNDSSVVESQMPATSPGSPKSTSSSSSDQQFCRDAVTKAALQRDQGRCIITNRGSKTVQVCHIYPVSLLYGEDPNSVRKRLGLWERLKYFWSEEKVKSWEDALFPRGYLFESRDNVNNVLCLDSSMQLLWNCGAFALRPINLSDDLKTLTLEFFWQTRSQFNMPTSVDLSSKPLSTRSLDRDIEGNRWYREDGTQIRSGDIITMTTDDVALRPLPSLEIMELQWNLQRIVGMSGAAEIFVEVVRDDSDYDGSDGWLSEDEIMDSDDVSDLELGEEVTAPIIWMSSLGDASDWHELLAKA